MTGSTGPGFIYFIRWGEKGPIKIGWSFEGVAKRLKGIQQNAWTELFLLGVMRGSVADERALHHRFKPSRIRGEWFHVSPELLQFIHKRANGLPPRPKRDPDLAFYRPVERARIGYRDDPVGCGFCQRPLGPLSLYHLMEHDDDPARRLMCDHCLERWKARLVAMEEAIAAKVEAGIL